MSYATDDEKYFAALLNDVRRDLGLQQLAMERNLNASAEDHSAWMLDANVFSHTGEGGSSASDRIREAGFDMEGQSWWVGENIAYVSVNNNGTLRDEIDTLHRNLMNSPGHYANIVNERASLIGIGLELGSYTVSGREYTVLMATQNFGDTSGTPLLDTGAPSGKPKEFATAELPDTQVAIERSEWEEGFNGNVYLSSETGADIVGTVRNDDFRLGDADDYVNGRTGNNWISAAGGNDTISAGNGDDRIFSGSGKNLVHAGSGDDAVTGGTGTDILIGGRGDDMIFGMGGNDRLYGGSGNDTLLGGGGTDMISGGVGNDVIIGGAGDDILSGGPGADTFVFGRGDGHDTVTDFQSGLDRILAEEAMLGLNKDSFMANRMEMDGDDVVISWSTGGSVTLVGKDLSIQEIADDIFAF